MAKRKKSSKRTSLQPGSGTFAPPHNFGSGPYGAGPFGGAPAGTVLQSPVSITEADSPVTIVPAGVTHEASVEERIGRPLDRNIALIQLRALIDAFQEVDSYDPVLHHNSKPKPALWIDDNDYLANIKELLLELRRLNDLIEAARKADAAKVAAAGLTVAKIAKVVCLSAAGVIGVGIGGIIMGSIYTVLAHVEGGQEVLQHIPLAGKGK